MTLMGELETFFFDDPVKHLPEPDHTRCRMVTCQSPEHSAVSDASAAESRWRKAIALRLEAIAVRSKDKRNEERSNVQ